MTYTPGNGYPDLSTVRAEIGVAATVLPDDQFEPICGAEQDGVDRNYEFVAPLPDKLYEVFLRSVARAVAARGVPLGILAADAEYGTVRLSARDSEITRLGGQYRKRVFA